MQEFPKALYRMGDSFEFDGLTVDMVVAESADDETTLRGGGWSAFDELSGSADASAPRRGRPPKTPPPDQDA